MATNTKQQGIYIWEGTDRSGKRLKGELPGVSINLVKADLRKQGIAPIKVKKKPMTLFTKSKKSIKPKDIAIFSRQLSTMISAGVPLVHALEIIGKGHENPSIQELVLNVKGDIEGGSSLSQALKKHPRQFDELFCNLVKAGEQAGILENLLDKIATYKEKTEAIKGKIRKAMFYPTTVLAVAFAVTVLLLVWVVPQFETMFHSFGADLPALTQFVLFLSRFFQEWWWLIFIVLFGGLFSIFKLKQTSDSFALRWDTYILKVPVLGPILRKATIARYARTLSTMFAAGVPLVEALESVAGACGNKLYTKAVMKMREDVATGQQLQMAMQQTKLFPNMAVQMVAIGEESGSLDKMLGKVADFFEREVDESVDALSSLIEPFIMVVLGGLIGGLVIAMYLPIFKMGQVF